MAVEVAHHWGFDRNLFVCLDGDATTYDDVFDELLTLAASPAAQAQDSPSSVPAERDVGCDHNGPALLVLGSASGSGSGGSGSDGGRGHRLLAGLRSSKDASCGKRSRAEVSKPTKDRVRQLEAIAKEKSDELAALSIENTSLRFRHNILSKVVRLRNEQLSTLTDCQDRALSPLGTVLGDDHRLRSTSGQEQAVDDGLYTAAHPVVDRDRFRRMGRREFITAWKAFTAEASVHLLALESSPDDSETRARLRQLCAEGICLFKNVSVLAPDTIMAVMQTHLETEQACTPEPGHWDAVLGTLELTVAQRKELLAVYGLYQKLMHCVLAERQALNQYLVPNLHGPRGMACDQQRVLSQDCDVLQAMMKNMRQEKAAHLLLRGFLFGQCITSMQFAKAAMYSYPHFPDATAIVFALAESEGGSGLVLAASAPPAPHALGRAAAGPGLAA